MAESVNRTVVVNGDDAGLVAMFQRMQESSHEMGREFQKTMERNSEALDKMAASMDNVINKMGQLARQTGGGGRAGFAGGAMGGMLGGGMAGGIASGVGAGIGIASFLSIGAMIGTAFTEGRKLEEAQQTLAALRGGNVATEDYSFSREIGVSSSDFMGYEAHVARSRGMTGGAGEDRNRVLRTLQAERAFGLGEGEAMGLSQFARSGGEDPNRVIARLATKAADSQLWNVKVSSKGEIEGFASLGEKISQVTSMTQSMMRGSERANTAMVVDLLGAFGGIGSDEFSGTRAVDSIGAIDAAIRNPTNQFMQAEMMSALSQANPEMMPHELQDVMSRGIYGEGTLDTLMGHFSNKFGGDQASMEMAMQKFTGGSVSLSSIRKMISAYQQNPGMFEGLGGTEIDSAMAKFTDYTADRAVKRTGEVRTTEAMAQDTLAEGGLGVIQALSDNIQSVMGGMLDWMKGGNMGDLMKTMGEIAEDIKQTANRIAEFLGKESEEDKARKEALRVDNLRSTYSHYAADPNAAKAMGLDSIMGIPRDKADADTRLIQDVISGVRESLKEERKEQIAELKETLQLISDELSVLRTMNDPASIVRRDDMARDSLEVLRNMEKLMKEDR